MGDVALCFFPEESQYFYFSTLNTISFLGKKQHSHQGYYHNKINCFKRYYHMKDGNIKILWLFKKATENKRKQCLP